MSHCCKGKRQVASILFRLMTPITLLGGLTVRDHQGWAVEAAPTKIKIPHNHMAEHGGKVLMVGDDHFEFTRDSKNPSEIRGFASDKFRDPVPVELFSLQVVLVQGDKRDQLTVTPTKNAPGNFSIRLPANAEPTAKLELRAPRVSPVRGQVTTSNPQVAELTSIPKVEGQASAHTGHQM